MFDILHGVGGTQNSNMNEVRGPGEMDFTSPQNLSETVETLETWHGILFDGNMHRQN